MVGLADLQKHLSNVKQCRMSLSDEYCYFSLTGVNTYDFMDVVNYKSWVYKTFQKMVNIRYVYIIKKLEKGNTILRTSVGFAPLLMRYLKIKGYQIRDEDIEAFKARTVVFPDFKINLYDFQERMVGDWLSTGGIGVIKSPTGSGKTIIGCNIIKKISRKTLILVHTSDLLVNVWNDSLSKSFGNGIMGQIGIIGGGLTDQDRAEMRLGVRSGDFEENIRKDIVIATFQTLMNRLDRLTQYKFGLMICDEVHHVPSNMFRKVNSVIRAPYKLGLSATLERLDGMTKGIYGQLGDVQSKVSIRELINRGILAEPRFQSPIIMDHEIIDSIQDSGLSGLNYSRLVKKKSAASQKKKDYVVNICKNIAARDRKFLLFTDYVNAEDVFVRDMYADSLLKEGTLVSVIDQGMTSDERGSVFNFLEKGDISGIIFGKLGSEGVNIPSVDVVVMANAIKCVSGDTLIPTDKGIIRAKDLETVRPSSVFTIDPDSGSVITAKINEFYNFDEEDTIRIRTVDGYEIEGSVSHRIVTGWSHGNIIYTQLSDIYIGGSVLICRNIGEKDMENDRRLIFYDKVVSKKKGKNKLYDMNIDKYHSFIAGGFINHNSPITFTQRVGRAMRRIPGKDFCDVYEVLLDLPTEAKWSHYNFAEYQAEGFQKLVYKVE